MKKYIVILFAILSINLSAQISNVSFLNSMKTIISRVNTNKEYLENLVSGTDTIPDITKAEITTQAVFATKLNRIFSSLAILMDDTDSLYSSFTSNHLIRDLNNNFDTLNTRANAFLAEPYDYYILTKAPTIPNKGTANILSQNEDYKLAYYASEDTLYLSSDLGKTWDYKKKFAGCDSITMCYVFESGKVLVIKRNNKVYSITNNLQTVTEIRVREMNGDTMQFHTPINPTYPGEYFRTAGVNAYKIGSKEVLLWGLYDVYNQESERNGSSPLNMYYTADDGETVKVMYKWGEGYPAYDRGTWDSGWDGDGVSNSLGNPLNSENIWHHHGTFFNPNDNSIWVATGEVYPQVHFAKCEYDTINDTWAVTPNRMPNEPYFRASGMAFFPEGDSLYWSSDQSGDIYKVSYDKITTSIINHQPVLSGTIDFLGISPYGETMFAPGYNTERCFFVSANYGRSWELMPTSYSYKTSVGQSDRSVKYIHHIIINACDSNGYYLIQRKPGNSPGVFNAKSTFLMRVVKKPNR